MRVVAAACGVITGLGDLDATWNGLLAGRLAVAPTAVAGIDHCPPLSLVPGLRGETGSAARLGELLALLAATLPPLSDDTRLLVAATKGAVDELLSPVPTVPPGQVPGLAAAIADLVGLADTGVTVSAACASGTMAIGSGASMIRSREAGAVLVVGVDLVSRFVVSGFDALKAMAGETCRPFDRKRDGLALGEGAAYVLLTSAERAGAMGLDDGIVISAKASSCDAVHITAPCREASGLIRTLRQIDSPRGGIGAINAHGTGTVFNDAMEIKAFEQVCPGVPFYSVKGAIGHCLGAAGVIEAAIAIETIKRGIIPPTVGLREPDEGAEAAVVRPRPLARPAVISCNSGFGGINAAVLFAREEK